MSGTIVCGKWSTEFVIALILLTLHLYIYYNNNNIDNNKYNQKTSKDDTRGQFIIPIPWRPLTLDNDEWQIVSKQCRIVLNS